MELAAWIQAGATAGLAGITVWYARSVAKQTEAARTSAEAARRSAEASERMARLQTREARKEIVPDLDDLRAKLRYLRKSLGNWEHNSPAWDKMRRGAEPAGPQFKPQDTTEAKELISGLGIVVDDEQRRTLADVVRKLEEFRTTAKNTRRAHQSGERSVAGVNDLEEMFDALDEELDEAIQLTDQLAEEIS